MSAEQQLFLAHLREIFGPEHTLLKHPCPRGGREVDVYVYRNCPEPGMITGVTYGLSLHPHPDWHLERPELMISMASTSVSWPFLAAYFAAEHRGRKRFALGDIFSLGEPISPDTRMDSAVLCAQTLLDPARAVIPLPDYDVTLVQLQPLHREEVPLCRKLGLEALWNHAAFDPPNPGREPLSGEVLAPPAEPDGV